jgi:hypothetical protein
MSKKRNNIFANAGVALARASLVQEKEGSKYNRYKTCHMTLKSCWVSGSHSNNHGEYSLLGCDAV